MGEEIFRHADKDGDVIRLERATTANPLLRAYVDSENEFALLDRDAVLSLIQALTEWAYPTHTPEGPNRSLIEELIVKAVKDQVSAVLPLHLSPVAEHRPQECPGAGRCPEADPEPGDVGHPRPPLPLRKKTVIVPECGLCKRPWNDGHGQPGDPCPGVEEARQHPGDWTDALWRVRPSAPASDARYCDGCGHSWESHDPECGATRGKGRCECDRRPE